MRRQKVLIIDNYDSFTYILKQYFGELGGNPEVFFHDQITINQVKRMKPTHLVLSPGPGTVEHLKDVGIMFDVIKEFYRKVPMLGVCLGHQAIGKFFGGQVVNAPHVMHGKRSFIYHEKGGIFKGLPSPFEAMRYHSLMVDPRFIERSELHPTAWAGKHLLMGFQHEKYPIFGVQFHPESLGTPDGMKIIKNFLSY